ncbi:GIY-YIG nuclease family protein [Candidatus Parcubacteria bacterium]|nr:GIY-YIG nuclease family protein [Candidatus Parcubacteria bacterium]
MYKVYILLCNDNSFYTGHTNNLKLRYKQHCWGEVNSTKNKRPLKLVYYEIYNTKEEAMMREKQLKGWTRQKKINLIKFGHPIKKQG